MGARRESFWWYSCRATMAVSGAWGLQKSEASTVRAWCGGGGEGGSEVLECGASGDGSKARDEDRPGLIWGEGGSGGNGGSEGGTEVRGEVCLGQMWVKGGHGGSLENIGREEGRGGQSHQESEVEG